MTDDADLFDWISDDSVAVPEQRSLAIYQNAHGQVVIRAERAWDEDRDTFIAISPEHVPKIVAAILEAAEFGSLPCRALAMILERQNVDWEAALDDFATFEAAHDEPKREPKDPTGAKRQREYRKRHRDGGGRDVTPRERDGDGERNGSSTGTRLAAAE